MTNEVYWLEAQPQDFVVGENGHIVQDKDKLRILTLTLALALTVDVNVSISKTYKEPLDRF